MLTGLNAFPLVLLGAHATPEGQAHAVPFGTTLLFAAVLGGMVLCLALEEKIHAKKSLITGVFAVIAVFLGHALDIVPAEALITVGHETLMAPVYISGIDWGVIAIILASSLFVDVTSRSGLFSYIAIRLTKLSGGDPLRLLWAYGIMTVVFSAVLNNVTAMIIVGSLTGVSLKKLNQQDKLLGFLLIEGLLTNIGGLLTLISSVPNIIVGQAAGISFMKFFFVASPYVVVATAATIFLGAKVFGISALSNKAVRAEAKEKVAGFDENDGIESKGFFGFASVMSVLFIICLAATSVLPVVQGLGMGFVAGTFALIMLLRFKSEVDQFYSGLDWDLIAFFCFLFAVIAVMEHAQVLHLIGQGLAPILALGQYLGTGVLMVAAAVASSVTDNIPLAAMLAKILVGFETAPDSALWWSVVFGANLGGNITPIGSASTVVAVTVIHKYGIKLSFLGFVKKAVPFAAMQLALAAIYVLVFIA